MIKKHIIGILFTTFITISNIDTIYGLEQGIVNECDYLNIRSGPNVKYSKVTEAYTNDIVEILEKSGTWYKIKTSSNIEGWVNSKYISSYKKIETKEKNNETKIEEVDKSTNIINNVIKLGNAQIGKKYKWGASGPNAFDCSGFTSYIYKNGAGITLPRTSTAQSKVGTKVSKAQLKAGDLVFFNTSGKGISHVGMYIGDSKFIHASTSKGIRIDSLNSSYYKYKFVSGSRIVL